ncbi:hypothetical protein [Aliagarivorans taiwanensis]|uniref:hypothetical protein n=1 Tax=Aliagarivorans taiwanensis TaxID=561966 RepID=UPI000422392A|nr:hypothetical protein [Aliagarivorans taiwanensis]
MNNVSILAMHGIVFLALLAFKTLVQRPAIAEKFNRFALGDRMVNLLRIGFWMVAFAYMIISHTAYQQAHWAIEGLSMAVIIFSALVVFELIKQLGWLIIVPLSLLAVSCWPSPGAGLG